jgi:arylformamidase
MKIFRLSNPIQNHWNWSGGSRLSYENNNSLPESIIDYPKHGFTHVDAPCHMIKGAKTLDECSLKQLCGEAAIIDVSDCIPAKPVNRKILEIRGKHVRNGDILILRSNLNLVYPNTGPEYWEKSPYIDPSGAQWIVERGCIALGVDFPQDYVAREMTNRVVKNNEFVEHHLILGANIMHLEHLVNLERIKQRRIFLIGLPLRIPNSDGGPSSPVAITEWPSSSPEIIDLTLPIQPDWRQRVQVKLALSFENGDQVQETGVLFLGHSHTHCLSSKYINADLHGLDSLNANNLVQFASIIDLSDVSENIGISASYLESRLDKINSKNILVLKTGYTDRKSYDSPNWEIRSPYLEASAADLIADKGFNVIAVDFEIDQGRKLLRGRRPKKEDLFSERILLENRITIVKNLTNLSSIKSSQFFIVIMPLNVPYAESAPARIIGLLW